MTKGPERLSISMSCVTLKVAMWVWRVYCGEWLSLPLFARRDSVEAVVLSYEAHVSQGWALPRNCVFHWWDSGGGGGRGRGRERRCAWFLFRDGGFGVTVRANMGPHGPRSHTRPYGPMSLCPKMLPELSGSNLLYEPYSTHMCPPSPWRQ
jgi:hypothetical protein